MTKIKTNKAGGMFFLSKRYHHFMVLIVVSTCAAYTILMTMVYKNHKSIYNQRALSSVYEISNSLESRFYNEGDLAIEPVEKELDRLSAKKNVSALMLDDNNNVINQIGSLPHDLFSSINCNDKNKENISIRIGDILYLAYHKIKNKPYCLVVGIEKLLIYPPLRKILIQYFLILSAITAILLVILNSFYRTIISPIGQISTFANQILNQDPQNPELTTKLQKCNFAEIDNLSQVMTRVGDYQRELIQTNQKLYEAYKLRYETQTKQNSLNKLNIEEVMHKFLKILYPEIYSKNLNIKQEYRVRNHNRSTKNHILCDILLPILSRSCFFSNKNKTISITIVNVSLDNRECLQIIIQDEGIGNEEWRSKNVDDEEFVRAITIIKTRGGLIHCLETKGYGVRYCIILPDEEEDIEKDNVVELFS